MSCSKKIILFNKTNGWAFLAIVALAISIDIEMELFLLPCNSGEKASAINRIILSLSYSYIAAAIFHFFVNYLPIKKRSISIKPFVNSEFLSLNESFRLCKLTVNHFDFRINEYTKDEYCQLFSKMDFYEDDDFSKGLSKYTRLENLRSKIAGIVTVLMSFREFLSDECFDYLIDIMNSTFIKNGLYPYQKDGNNYYCNQDEVLACIFDLYEASRVITSQMRSYEIVDIHTTFDFKHFKRK